MPDTSRTLAALQALLADNTSAAISPQDIRDFLVSVFPQTTKGDLPGIDTSGIIGRLPPTTDGFVLTLDAASTYGFKWEAAGAGAHPNLATHDALGLATDAELTTHAALTTHHAQSHGNADHTTAFTDDTTVNAHISDATAAHAASAISADSTTLVGVGTDVQAVLEELDNGIVDHAAAADPHGVYVLEAAHASSSYDAGHHAAVTIGADVQHSLAGQVLSGVDASTTQKGHAKFDTTVAAAVGTAAAGASGVIADRAHVHPTGAGTPSTQAFGDAAAAGAGPAASMTDHKHAMPADPVTAHVALGDPHTGYVLESLYDLLGDIHYASADNTPAKLAGNTTTTKQFLRQTGNGTVSAAPAWDTVLAADVVATAMKQTLLLQGWSPTTTAGCAPPAKSERGTTTKHDILSLAFDSATAENAYLHHPMPDNWDGGAVTFRVWWYAKTGWVSGTSDGVAWTLKATSYGDDQSIDSVFGTGITVTDTATTLGVDKLQKTADSAALTVAGAAAGELIHWVITRTVSDAADDWAADVELVSVVVEYGITGLSS